MTPEDLSAAIRAALGDAVAAGQLSVPVPDEVRVERPRSRDHGDWATNVALQLAKPAGMPPRDVAEILAERMRTVSGVAAVDVAGPGFLNITLDAASAGELARSIVEAGAAYGTGASEAGRTVNLEYISANPTGPLHIGHTRWAALGDAMVRVLRAAGARVAAEYYINDAGAQMDKFGGSILAALRGTAAPEGGYEGDYVRERAAEVVAARPDLLDLPEDEQVDVARDLGCELQLAAIRRTLDAFNVHFDVWFSERTLHEGAVEQAVGRLREQGHVEDRDGAIWLRTTDFGDDKDRVLVRANGVPTYFAADAAYYLSKKDRGFTEKIYLLGADHHGYIGRLKAIAACAGDDPEHNIEVKIGQLVNIAGERMGKRRGNALYMDELIEWLGSDALRYSLARYPADSPLDLDGEQLRRQTNDNPVFYVQYAHARTRNVARLAEVDGVRRTDGFDAALLTDETEAALLAALGDYPRVLVQAARLLEPHRVARYLEELAARYHKWYDTCRVRPANADEAVTDLHRTRLWLNDATAQVLANGLGVLGVSAPERM
ncbi:arginine--tRNA ligase [Nostocoides sp. F2B08]|uniref:arginine--tRNA ligase n=1 Tax=Nostocoides sp. F2B08 TaxID=2653936 RepID=UPI001262B4BE|nr:arginine--tRNA ligase [Tetrasphaera sp. F2B08]KAB7746173.1 arginine--tRNA ligase [Tetrasphaera sp. F2B08]